MNQQAADTMQTYGALADEVIAHVIALGQTTMCRNYVLKTLLQTFLDGIDMQVPPSPAGTPPVGDPVVSLQVNT